MTRPINRRQFVQGSMLAAAVVGLGGPLAACGSDDKEGAGGTSAINIQLKWLKNAESAGFWIADDSGYYRDENVTPNFIAGGPNIATTTAIVAGGKADIGEEQLLTVIDSIIKGEDLVIIGTEFQTNPLGILSLPGKPVNTAADLVDMRIGMQQGAKEQVDALFKINGLDPEYSQVPIGFDPEPLVHGDCDAITAFVTNQAITLDQQGVDHVATTFGAMGLNAYSNVLFAKRSYLDKNKDKVVAFMRASIKGWEQNAQDPDLGAKLAVEKYGKSLGLDPEQQKLQSTAQVPLTQSDLTREKGMLYVSVDELAGPMYDGYKAAGRSDLPPAETVIDTSFLEAAFDGKTSLL